MKLSIIIPAYNEESAIKNVVDEVKKINLHSIQKEIIIVDDGSKDKTYEIAKNISDVNLLKHKYNKGKASALKNGFDHATGELLMTIDADCTYPVSSIPFLVDTVKKEDADMVIASRFLGQITAMSKLNYYGNVAFSKLISILTGKVITDGSSGMRVFKHCIWDDIDVKSRGLDWEVEMTTKVIQKGYDVFEIPIAYSDRVGSSKLNPLTDGFRFFVAIIRGRFF